MSGKRQVFIAGGTGYIGSRLITALQQKGHAVTALVREHSISKLPSGCNAVIGDALTGDSYCSFVKPGDTFIHLVGVSHPSPAKAAEFSVVDGASGLEAIRVARERNVSHFVYVSVAHPAPVMQAYVRVRQECERVLASSGLNATVLRPWYVTGPGHRWPYLLIPFYRLAEIVPQTREGAKRLGLINIDAMVRALLYAVENPSAGLTVLSVPDIRAIGRRNGVPAA
jgi:nucleoside-diphosphate-sugar epimerase